ncbi:myelin regulatory factor-like protein isoform X2 [Triplophysa rosa]|uniref:myelin regulatory factor-like protein isoform X2 n=1 Tax=Triplophysa rosa TaxID=992332 RepID=UPI002545F15D|nr:myelin regulatory factor-like protein isoform X2 [Triplophysa rosa]
MSLRRPADDSMDVLGEREALQQFFNGEDASGVLDTSFLEEYLSNESDSTFMLPESPPDSCSERSSPPQIPGSGWTRAASLHVGRDSLSRYVNTSESCHDSPALYALQHHPCTQMRSAPVYTSVKQHQRPGDTSHENKKRRRSDPLEGNTEPCRRSDSLWTPPTFCGDRACEAFSSDSDGAGHHVLSWDRYQPSRWSRLYNGRLEALSPPGYHVDADKGFGYSTADEAFVCQKKNHFQVTVHIGMLGDPAYVETPAGPVPVESFHVKVFGVKMEAHSHFITIEQSQSDRSKKPFLPVKVQLPRDKITKVTLSRLHFSETTANNMRKKGKPNPDQRYFMMVVGLYATVSEEKSFLLVANVSERLIVRASNPGQFENDTDVLWQRGQAPETVVCHGRIGINTDNPDESLVVCGNAKIMGNVMHPSDRRAKENIQEVDSMEQLRRIAQMRIVEYDYKPEFASRMGIDQVHETGIIAQEVKELLPSAVREMGDVTCVNGETIPHFLMVDKIFMENVGAVKQLCKLTDNLETRIQELEVWNSRLAKLKRLGSLRSSNSSNTKAYEAGKSHATRPAQKTSSSTSDCCERYQWCLQHRVFQASIIMLVTTMALCVISITALYMLTLDEDVDFNSSLNSSDVVPPFTTTETQLTTASATSPPAPWPPDIDFSNVFYSDEIYCCPSNLTSSTATDPRRAEKEEWTAKLPEILKNSTDWKNTTIRSIIITQNLQMIDQQYCDTHDDCGKGKYSYVIPLSKHIPPNMPITLQITTDELLVMYLCSYDERDQCYSVLEHSGLKSNTALNTQGYIHKWTLAAANHYRSSYHFRVAVAGLANCSTDPNYAEFLFTDYQLHFFRRCD